MAKVRSQYESRSNNTGMLGQLMMLEEQTEDTYVPELNKKHDDDYEFHRIETFNENQQGELQFPM